MSCVLGVDTCYALSLYTRCLSHLRLTYTLVFFFVCVFEHIPGTWYHGSQETRPERRTDQLCSERSWPWLAGSARFSAEGRLGVARASKEQWVQCRSPDLCRHPCVILWLIPLFVPFLKMFHCYKKNPTGAGFPTWQGRP